MANVGEHHDHERGEHPHQHEHDHQRPSWGDRLRHPFGHGHGHDPGQVADAQLEASQYGQRALLVSVLGLGATALLQALVVWRSGSIALLGDTLHNFADALTAVPLAVAFRLARRPPNRRYTYGYGRAEDLAGIAIVVLIAASSALAAFEALRRLRDPVDVRYLGAVAGAAVVGFAGNELVARYRIRVGRQIGSAALVADGLHARTDGFASLAVLVGVAGVALGMPLADPLIGLVITGAILAVGWDAARQVYRRLMDAVDPSLVEQVERVLRATPGVLDVGELRLRWIGHRLRAECAVVVDHHLTVVEAHRIAEEAEHRLLHEVPRLTAALVHADPFPHQGTDYHRLTGPHTSRPERPQP
jgi:cation diffusion facilitator family transporter